MSFVFKIKFWFSGHDVMVILDILKRDPPLGIVLYYHGPHQQAKGSVPALLALPASSFQGRRDERLMYVLALLVQGSTPIHPCSAQLLGPSRRTFKVDEDEIKRPGLLLCKLQRRSGVDRPSEQVRYHSLTIIAALKAAVNTNAVCDRGLLQMEDHTPHASRHQQSRS